MENIRAVTMQQQLLVVLVVVAVGILQAVPPVCSLGLGSAESQLGEVRATTITGSQQQIQVTPQTAAEYTSEEALHQQHLALQMMQYHHEKSPYAKPNLKLKDRALIAVKSSQERARTFNGRMQKGSRRSQNKGVFTSPTNSNEGSYLMQIELGTPAKVFSAILDTGSDLVWIQCEPCTSCYTQPDPIFDPTTSSSYAAYSCTEPLCAALPATACAGGNACEYRYGYGDASTTQGIFSTETITLTSLGGGTQSYPGFAFGCGNLNQGLFKGTDGLVGLGQGPVSLVKQLGNQFGNVFSYCLVDFYAAPTQSSQLLLGSVGGGLVYTPIIPNNANPTFYYLGVKGILVNGAPLDIPAGTFDLDAQGQGGFIIDSGTTLTQLQEAAYTPLLTALESLIDYPRVDGSSIGLDLCYDLSQVANPTVPSVTFQFDGVDVDLPGDNLFLQVDTIGDFCLAIQGSEFGFGIFGNVQQQNFNVAFDRANARIGFAPKTC